LGSREALAQLFHQYSKLVRSVAIRILRDASEADDLLQDIFVFIHRKSYIFDRGKSTARSWIVQMTYHRAIDRRRELQARHFYSQVALVGGVEVPDQNSKSDERMLPLEDMVGNATIEGLFDALTEDQRNTLCLHFYEGYTFGEIAEKLGQPLGNIRHHYYRGLDKLRQQIFKRKIPGRNGDGRR
jgi:RNA polymerase sigma-70 factor (ECF subfamily)